MRLRFTSRTIVLLVAFLIAGAWVSAPLFADTAPAAQPEDPSGVKTGTAADIGATDKSTILDLANAIGHNRVAINIMWTLDYRVSCHVHAGRVRHGGDGADPRQERRPYHGHELHDLSPRNAGVLAMGFGLMFGGTGAIGTMGGFNGLNKEITLTLFGKSFGLFGGKGFMLNGAYDVGAFALFLFQMVFMDTTATIPTGAMAERWKYSAFFIYGVAIGLIMYPIYGNWVWGGGWLSQLGANFGLGHGHVDFAGSSVVHMRAA